jgi:hypothetical protein
VWTVFGDPLPPLGRVELTGPVEEDAAATVRLTDFPAGAAVAIAACPRDDGDGGDDACRTAATTVLDREGRATVTIDTGGIPCDRRSPCVVTARSTERLIRSRVTPLRFLDGPGVDHDPLRLGLGLGVAAALLAMCAWFLARTDWSAAGEAAAPEIDDADYADLDAIIAALPPEPDVA